MDAVFLGYKKVEEIYSWSVQTSIHHFITFLTYTAAYSEILTITPPRNGDSNILQSYTAPAMYEGVLSLLNSYFVLMNLL